MLPTSSRLRSSSDFSAAVRSGRRAGSPQLVVHALVEHPPDPTAAIPPRVGFVVSKAVGNAVVRNRVKRRLRHAARQLLTSVPPGTRLVVRALPAAASADWPTLERQLTRCWQRALGCTGPTAGSIGR